MVKATDFSTAMVKPAGFSTQLKFKNATARLRLKRKKELQSGIRLPAHVLSTKFFTKLANVLKCLAYT
jgi:hypothetical protein